MVCMDSILKCIREYKSQECYDYYYDQCNSQHQEEDEWFDDKLTEELGEFLHHSFETQGS